MKYYLLSVSSNEQEIGIYFQTEGLLKGYSSEWYNQPNSMTKLVGTSLPSFTPDLKWELKPEAILTDIISAGNITATGFLMSPKAKSIFQDYNLPEHKFHNSKLIVNSRAVRYHYLQLIARDFKDIDLERSSFCVTNVFRMKEGDINITGYDDLIARQKLLELGSLISAEKLYIKNNDFDLFFFHSIHGDVFISKRLLNALVEYKITGYEVQEQHILY